MKFPYASYMLCDDAGFFWRHFNQNKGKLTKSAYFPSFQPLYSVTRGVGFGSETPVYSAELAVIRFLARSLALHQGLESAWEAGQ